MFANRISHKMLATLCERVGVAFDVGHDPHKIFERESQSLRGAYAKRMGRIAKHVQTGGSLADAVKAQGNYFPNEFVQMVDVGEKTGRLEVVMNRLASYYRGIANVKTEFLNSITWPLVQLFLALTVIGALIYVPAVVAPDAGDEADLLGWGMLGWDGLKTYLTYVVGTIIALGVLGLLARNGVFSFVLVWIARLPFVGPLITVFAESRFVQALVLALESGLDSWNSVALSFRSASSPLFIARAESAKKAIRQGRELHLVLQETHLFSKDTIEAVQLGEESGRLPEVLDKQFAYLQTRAKGSLSKFSNLASTLIWVIIAAVLIFLIVRVFGNYLGSIEDAGQLIINRGQSNSP